MPNMEPTTAELVALRAYIEAGSVREAATSLGLNPQTIKKHLASLRDKTGAKTTAEVVYLLYPRIAA